MAALGGGEALLASTTAFALVITKIVDFTRNAFDKNTVLKGSWVWNALALGLGLACALIWQINIFANVSHTYVQGWAGEVLTGLAMGASGSGWHEVLDVLSSTAKRANPPPG